MSMFLAVVIMVVGAVLDMDISYYLVMSAAIIGAQVENLRKDRR